MLLKIIMKQLQVLMQDSFQCVTVKCCIYNNLTFKYFLHLMFQCTTDYHILLNILKCSFFDLERGVMTSLLYTSGVNVFLPSGFRYGGIYYYPCLELGKKTLENQSLSEKYIMRETD